MFRLWLTVLVLATVLTADKIQASQETLDSLIASALNNNPGYMAANFKAGASDYTARAAGTLPDPDFSIGLMNVPRSSLALDETPMSGVAVGLTQMIPWPGKLAAKSRRAGLEYQRDTMDARAVRNRLIHDVAVAYQDYSFWTLTISIIKDNIALINATTRVTEERYAQGDAAAHDVFQAQTTGSRLEIRLLKAERMRESALLELRRLVKDTSLTAVMAPYLPEPSERVDIAEGVTANPMLRNAALSVEQAEAERSMAKSEYYPDLMFGAQYLLRQTPMDGSMNGDNWLSIHLGVSLPLWFFSKQKNQVRASSQALMASREREREVRDMLEREFADARVNMNTLTESLESYDTAILPQARAGFEAAEIAYQVGKIDFDALLYAQIQLLDVELERLELLNEINQVNAQLRELAGSYRER